MKENKTEKELLLIKAIDLYNSNWKVTNICSTLNRKRS